MLQSHFAELARYNRWANTRLYEAAAALTDDQYRSDRGVFFKSMHGTLNHLLVTDRIWLQRITGTGEAPDRLDAILFDDLPALHAARSREDERLIATVDALTDDDLAGIIRYRRVSSPEPIEAPRAASFAHLFNHQTHHRGQAHAVLTGLVDKAPELDLLIFQRLANRGSA